MSKNKLPDEIVAEIFTSVATINELMNKYNLSRSQILNIRRKKNYWNVVRDLQRPPRAPHSKRSLTKDKVRVIFVAEGSYTQIGKQYGTSASTVAGIKSSQIYCSDTEDLVPVFTTYEQRGHSLQRIPSLPSSIPTKERLRITIDEFFK